MNLKAIKERIGRLSVLVEGWSDPAAIPAIERDLALEELRKLYEELRFEAAPVVEPAVTEVIEAARTEEPEPMPEPEIVPAEPEKEEAAAAPVEEPEEPARGVTMRHFSLLSGVDRLLYENSAEPEPVANPEPVSEFEPEPELVPEPEPAVAPALPQEAIGEVKEEPVVSPAAPTMKEPAGEVRTHQTLFGPEEKSSRHRHKQRVIMSLYDAAPRQEAPKPVAKAEEPVAAMEDVLTEITLDSSTQLVEVEAAQVAAAFVGESPAAPAAEAIRPTGEVLLDEIVEEEVGEEPEEPFTELTLDPDGGLVAVETLDPEAGEEEPLAGQMVSVEPAESAEEPAGDPQPVVEPEPVPASGAVLGEVINQNVQTLADTIAPPRDMASALSHSEPVTDLRKAIGINDKFLMIRDLFGGDGASYEIAIRRLNNFQSLDDCMIYIAENYAWNPNSDGAKFLMDLLERKYM